MCAHIRELETDNPRIIVSFTTYPARIHVVKQVLDTLYAQTMPPDAILLWLAEEQFPGKEADLPEELRADLAERKFEVRWCDDLGSHKKYFYTLQEYPNDIVITVDDDTLYHPKTIETLFLSYRGNPKAVSALRANVVCFDKNDEITPFQLWLDPFTLRVGSPSMQLVAVGMGGVLYPPQSALDRRVFDKAAIKELCRIDDTLFGDDLWLKAHEALAGTPVVLASDSIVHEDLEQVQDTALWKRSPMQAHKDRLLNSLKSRYRDANGDVLLAALQRVVGDDLRLHYQNRDFLQAHCNIRDLKLLIDLNFNKYARIAFGKQRIIKMIPIIINQINRFNILNKTEKTEQYFRELQKFDVLPAEATALVAALREQALRLPDLEDMKSESFAIRALVDHGVALSTAPFSGPWKEFDNGSTRLELARRWVEFVFTHPECADAYRKDLVEVLQRAQSRLTQPGRNPARGFLSPLFVRVKQRLLRLVKETARRYLRPLLQRAKWRLLPRPHIAVVSLLRQFFCHSERSEESPDDRSNCPKVSVIVPVYTPGPGIDRCLESLRGQTLADIELIFVDDCGTDGAMDKVRAAAAEDSRIRVITNPANLGPGPSRNAGIEAARGEYLSFVDADDYISPDFLELLYARARIDGLDIAKGSAVYELNGLPRQRRFERNDVILMGLLRRRPLYTLFVGEHWTGLYRRAMLMASGARYGTARNSQDDVFLLRVCHVARTFGMESRATYHYAFRQSSIVNTFHAQRLKNQLASLQEQMDHLANHVACDENAGEYAAGKVRYLLKMHAHAAGIPGLEAAADEFLAGLRVQALRLPCLERMKAAFFSLRALVDYGVGLSVEPYAGLWEELDNTQSCLSLVKRWCDFALVHPEFVEEYGTVLSQVLQKAADAVAREKKYGPRIDVKIYGTENSELELRGVSGNGAKVTTPDWLYRLRSPGTGYVVELHPGQPAVTLDFICKTGGELTAMLRGAYVRDRNGKLVPKWVTCTGLTCNGDVVFEGRKRVWHGQPYHYTRPVRAGETVQLGLRWQPESLVPEDARLPKGLAQDSPSPKVSVVVPVWNPGPGFERCLESLRAQSLADIELIFVDDCGTDGAMDKVRAAAAEDGRIRIIANSENLSPGLSRNRGIEAARGEYLSFVDADDYVSSDFLELLYNRAWTDGLDIAKGCCVWERNDATRPLWRKSGMNETIRSGLARHNPLYRLFHWGHWSALYRRAVLMESGARYGASRNSEDTSFLLRVCHAARNLGTEDRATYHYMFRETSAVNTFSAQRLKNQLDGLQEQVDYLVAHVTHDNDAVGYALDKLGYLLGIHAYAACIPELGDAAAAFLAELREQALRLPFIESVKARSFAIRALVDHGVNLHLGIYVNPWGTVDRTRARIALARRWADFALTHPACACEYGGEALALLCKRVKRRLTRPGNNTAHR